MNRFAFPTLSILTAAAIMASPVAQASVVSDFKAEATAKIGTKTGNAAAKAGTKTIAKYVAAAPKGDPKKIVTFTKYVIKLCKKLNANPGLVKFWSKFVTLAYFKKGKIDYDPNDSKYKKAQSLVYKLKGVKKNQSVVQKAFNELKKNNSKLKGTDEDLGVLQEEVAKASKVTPES